MGLYTKHSAEDEIYHSMEKQLVSNQVENHHGFNKLAKVADLLNIAVVIFDQAGMYQEANGITQVLQSLAKEIK